jgi:hypothetical protein
VGNSTYGKKNNSIGRGSLDVTDDNIREIIQMARDNIQQRNNSKRARQLNYNIEDRDIAEIVKLVRKNDKKTISKNIFNVNRVNVHRRFGYNENVYEVSIGPNNASTLPEFLENLRQTFSYLINIMKYIASSGTDKARFYISKAPHTAFSTAILNVEDFNTDMFFDIFERHMQSNAKEVLDNGWSCTVSLYIFPNNYVAKGNNKHL